MNTNQYSRRERVYTLLGLVAIGIAIGSGIGWLGAQETREGNGILAEQKNLDAYGKKARGEIIDTQIRGSKTPLYSISYRFQTETRHYASSREVGVSDYSQARVGAEVRVRYLPNNPTVSRISQSIDTKLANEHLQSRRVLTGLAWAMPFLLAVGCLLPKRYTRR